MSRPTRPWDLLVVGGGTAGLVGATTAAQPGARVALVERERTGGNRLWTGWVPSTALLAAAGRAADARGAGALGVRVHRGGTIGCELAQASGRLGSRVTLTSTHPYPTYGDGVWNAAIDVVRGRLAAPAPRRAAGALVAVRRSVAGRRRPGRRARALTLLVASALGLSACSTTSSAPAADEPGPTPVVLEPVLAGPREEVPSALDDPADPALPAPLVDPERILPGGPPPDGIPSIDSPTFHRAADVDWLGENEAVVSLDLDGAHRAYPVQILHWHEIVNDTVDGRPVAVTYCPLCNSALAFDRQVGDRLLTFGTSGSLYLSALVMYDRQTESLWSQVERTALAGALTGTELELIPVTTIRWADWRAAFPDGWVLSRETGAVRDYGTNPYVGYDDLDNTDTLLDEAADPQYAAKLRVVVFPEALVPLAVLASDLARAGVAEIAVDGAPVVLFSSPGLASALDVRRVAEGAPITATGAFRPEVDGRVLSFRPLAEPGDPAATREDGAAVARDEQTGSQWDLLGRAVSGPLAGARLTAVPHLNTFWFAQAAFRPETQVIRLEP